MKIGVFKCGNIGVAPVFELLLDELAEREDLKVRTVTTGSKMGAEDVEEALPKLFEFDPNIIVFISPNPAIPGPAKVREILSEKGIPSVVISDGVAKRIKDELGKQGLGYMIIMGDPLIGARREFLDPIEMAIFNSNILKVLAITGVLRVLHQEIDRLIALIKEGLTPTLPRLLIDTALIRDRSDFQNPYAKAKAMAAYELTKKIAEIDTQACFIEREREKYIPLVACAHEIAQIAAKLAEEAREIEKYSDTLARKPHSKNGQPQTKVKLMLPPSSDEKVYKKWFKTLQP
ncbi:MAG: F420-dependent methylenetetrahydromethanopterin dehydrogenase [Candidatus Bathyarchaeota archaeon]|nr:F420-dependent methylenetetrahydromethanopterin dehydrogenase [Candidatus Bathyarchaeota archaeon]MDH5780526.1 F420-dependent methylenetetrahydromethanopterin dehydrogenase [Candidatus Bathyarchaeota archaeon]